MDTTGKTGKIGTTGTIGKSVRVKKLSRKPNSILIKTSIVIVELIRMARGLALAKLTKYNTNANKK